MQIGDLSPSSRRGSVSHDVARASALTFFIFLAVAGWQMLPVSSGNDEVRSAAALETLEPRTKKIESEAYPLAHAGQDHSRMEVREAVGAVPSVVERTATGAPVTNPNSDALKPISTHDPLPTGPAFVGAPSTVAEVEATAAVGPDPAQAAPNAEGWWVVLGSSPEASFVPARASTALNNASRCNLSALRDRSSEFEGFAPGLIVYLAGPYADRTKAQTVLRQARGCIGDAYMKWAKRSGEHRPEPA